MLVLGYTHRVEEVASLGDILMKYIEAGLRGYRGDATPSDETLDALATEIWNAPQNRHLRASSSEDIRGHDANRGPARPGTLLLYPDEYLYLPFLEGGDSVHLAKLDLATQGPGGVSRSVDNAADASNLVGEWLDERLFARTSVAIQPDHLESYVLNTALRQKKPTTEIFFYLEEGHVNVVDVAPSTLAGGQSPNHARATPDWFLPLWAHIDRLKKAAEDHLALFERLQEAIAEGRMVAKVLDTVGKFIGLMEDKLKPPPPEASAFRRWVADMGQNLSGGPEIPQNLGPIKAHVEQLRQQAESEFVAKTPLYPELQAWRDSALALTKVETDPHFSELYEAFTKERHKFPLTEIALIGALTPTTMARVVSPESEEPLRKLVDAFLKSVSGPTPITKEIAYVFGARKGREYLGDAMTSTMSLVGNAPRYDQKLWIDVKR